MLIFVEHIRKLTIKFICLFQFRFSNTVTISPLKGWDTLSVFLLTIYVRLKSLGFALMSPTKSLTYKSCCLLTSAFISLLKVSNFDLSLLLPVFFACACVLLLLSRLLNKGSYQIKIFLNQAITRVTIEVPIFCKVRRIFPHPLKISFVI